jgi:hypothetical protein
MAGFGQRMLGAAKLDAATYEEVEADKSATGQAMTVVILAAAAYGLGEAGQGIRGALAFAVAGLVGWLVWAFLTWIIGTRLLATPDTRSDMGELLRTIGFSSTPGILRILGGLPVVGGPVVFVVSIWMLAAMVVAVRQALDYTSTLRAVVVCLIGWLAYVGILFVTSAALGTTAWLFQQAR